MFDSAAFKRALVATVALAAVGVAAEVNCGSVGQTHTLGSGQSGVAYMKGSEAEACEDALSDLAPDSCATCPENQSGCVQANAWTGNTICETTQHPNGMWSAEVYPETTVKVFTSCSRCVVQTP